MKLAILDFDGTLYRGDSMRDFARFLNPVRYYISLLKLSFPYIQMLTGNASRNDLKSLFLKYNFAGYSEQELNDISERILGNQDEVKRISDQLMSKKMIDLFRAEANLKNKKVSYEDFVKQAYKS